MNYLYTEGIKKMNTELDVVKLVKNLRYLKILVKNSFINEEIKIMIMNS